MRRDVFQAIADPTRRDIIMMVVHEALNLNAIAEKFKISRPAISKHIKILQECGLIKVTQKGRERYCEVQVAELDAVNQWVDACKKIWEQRFDSLDSYLKEIQNKK